MLAIGLIALAVTLNVESYSLPKPPRPPGLCTKPVFTAVHPKDDDRIVGGLEAADGQFKYQASIQAKFSTSSSHFCGGSYIASNFVATAAHCVKGKTPASIVVKGGSVAFDENAVTSIVSKITVHPDYDARTVQNDIAILQLESPVEGANIGPVQYLTSFQETPEKTSCITSGWGTTSEGGGSLPDNLRFVAVDIVSDAKCRDEYGEDEIADSMICAGFDEGQKDSCQGDSGGPLVCDDKLAGIVSWGYGCARPNYAGVYTQVSHFSEWIDGVIKDANSV